MINDEIKCRSVYRSVGGCEVKEVNFRTSRYDVISDVEVRCKFVMCFWNGAKITCSLLRRLSSLKAVFERLMIRAIHTTKPVKMYAASDDLQCGHCCLFVSLWFASRLSLYFFI